MLFKSLKCQWVNPWIGLANDSDLGRHMASLGHSELIDA